MFMCVTITTDNFRYNLGKALDKYDSDEPPPGNSYFDLLAIR